MITNAYYVEVSGKQIDSIIQVMLSGGSGDIPSATSIHNVVNVKTTTFIILYS